MIATALSKFEDSSQAIFFSIVDLNNCKAPQLLMYSRLDYNLNNFSGRAYENLVVDSLWTGTHSLEVQTNLALMKFCKIFTMLSLQ